MSDPGKRLFYIFLLALLILLLLPLSLINGNYSTLMLLAIPFGIGFVFSLLIALNGRVSLAKTMGLSLIPIALSIASCIFLAGEGAICLIIVGALLLLPFYWGVFMGYMVQHHIWVKNSVVVLTFFTILSSFTSVPDYGEEKCIRDEVLVPVSRQDLWEALTDTVAFGSSQNFFFRNGVSYPLWMQLVDSGNTKYLNCRYNNGFVKAPVTGYEAQTYFAFRLGDSIASMREQNFYRHTQTMHLQHHFEIGEGKFEIHPISPTSCKLVASTTYRHRFEPAFYTDLWVEYLVHKLHHHVLQAVQLKAAQNSQ